jgi:ribosomal subunit interface protein
MEKGLQVAWHHIRPSEAVAQRVREKVHQLHRYHANITGCAVALEKPSGHHRHSGPQYRVRIELTVPGGHVVVGRDPARTEAHTDLYAALNAAFHEARRQLQDQARRAHHMVKKHAEPNRASVARLFRGAGYGFLVTPDGREIYFHEKSVVRGGFRRIRVGSAVRFVEELGVDGPQATTVTPVRLREQRLSS